METELLCIFLLRSFRFSFLIHLIGWSRSFLIRGLYRGVCVIRLITQLIRIVFLGYGNFLYGIALAISVCVFATILIVFSDYIGCGGSIDVS